MTEPILRLHRLTGGYPSRSVFRDVNLRVEASESVGLIGPVGHGKTALLQTIAGLASPARGRIQFCGEWLNQSDSGPALRPGRGADTTADQFPAPASVYADHGIVYVTQGSFLLPCLTVDDVLGNARESGEGYRELATMRLFVKDLFPALKACGLTKVKNLKGAERRMVSIAAGLLCLPRLLILDDPTSGSDPNLQAELHRAIQAIRQTKLPLIIADQNVGFVSGVVDRLFLFEHGSVTLELDRDCWPDLPALLASISEKPGSEADS